jgi:hypothetical protein
MKPWVFAVYAELYEKIGCLDHKKVYFFKKNGIYNASGVGYNGCRTLRNNFTIFSSMLIKRRNSND